MKTKYYPLLLLLILCFSIWACKKDNREPEREKTKAELLVGKWQIEKMYNLQNEDDTDDCTNKTTFEFLANNDMRWSEWFVGTEKCSELAYHEHSSVKYQVENGLITIRIVTDDGKASFDDLSFDVSEESFTLYFFEGHKGLLFKRIQ
ncbi:hypothetical protein FAZ15_03610 [Sphingobacterium olei]|uniref:Lipocalin-like domain-containing protein n=1 Tax=Sphingobacterium olei TaxID=2571155 RepID=A0A4U0P7M3_9SPHI|nr:lipocalin family protein [Sphingobacterium olei]TJZ63379.1 hypothetical protein FAZ15_03610 [Sphingobacterium olei]